MFGAIKHKFNKISEEHRNLSSLVCLGYAVVGERLTPDEIKKLFNELVDKGDYSRKDKDKILKDLLQLTRK